MKRKYGSRRNKYPACNKYNGKEECSGHYVTKYYLNNHIGNTMKKETNDPDIILKSI